MSLEKTYVAIDLEPERTELGPDSPLHITVTPPVRIELDDARRLEESLQEHLSGMASFTIRATEEDYFGPEGNPVRVRRFDRTTELFDLHKQAFWVVQGIVPGVDSIYAGENYRPHATYKPDKGIEQGEQRKVDAVTILRKDNDLWRRFGAVPLRGA